MNRLLPGWADAHLHFADPRIDNVQTLVEQAQALGVHSFLQGGVGPEDWARQRVLAAQFAGLLPVYGLHPYWVSDHSGPECEMALDQLARDMMGASALGETGLDFRPHICKDSEARQIACFESQLEMSRIANLPVVLHLVQAHAEALRVLELFGDKVRGMVHAFTGSAAEAEDWCARGLMISVGGPVCRPDFKRLHQAVKAVPLDLLLLETDSPDQPPPGILPGHNSPSTLLQVADAVAQIKGLSRTQVLDKSRENLEKLLYGNQSRNAASASRN
ncbi:MAG: TatD family hydrolase [Bdellovibrio sp.]|jgi:TatD DNase family protein